MLASSIEKCKQFGHVASLLRAGSERAVLYAPRPTRVTTEEETP
jgi:hypothetical protein